MLEKYARWMKLAEFWGQREGVLVKPQKYGLFAAKETGGETRKAAGNEIFWGVGKR